MIVDFFEWLASPLRVMVTLVRGCVLAVILIPPVACGPPGLLLTVGLGLPLWIIFTLALYGPRVMCWQPVSLRDWLWRHVTALWETPLEDA